jgi:hypothetical protein
MSQFLEVLEHYDPTGDEIAFRVPPEGSAEIKFGAQLVVHEAQEAVFYRDGRALDSFGPGRHTLTTQNVPVLTKALSLPFGFTSPFRIQVVFVSRRTFLDQKWGTREPVVFRDRELGVVRLRAFGTYAYRIADARTFVNTVVGSLGQFDTGRLQDFYRDLVVARLNDLLGENLTSILDLPASYDELAALAYGAPETWRLASTCPTSVAGDAARRGAGAARRARLMGAIGDLSRTRGSRRRWRGRRCEGRGRRRRRRGLGAGLARWRADGERTRRGDGAPAAGQGRAAAAACAKWCCAAGRRALLPGAARGRGRVVCLVRPTDAGCRALLPRMRRCGDRKILIRLDLRIIGG